MDVVHFSDARNNFLAECYVEIAAKNYLQAESLLEKLRGHVPASDAPGDGGEIFQHIAVCIVFSALAVESYLNDYACKIMGDSFFYENLQSLSPLSKLQLCHRIVTGEGVDRGTSVCYSLLKKLTKLRNDLVHNKSCSCQTMSEEDLRSYDAAVADGSVGERTYEEELSFAVAERTAELADAWDSLRAIFETARLLDSIDDHAYSEITLLGSETGFGRPEAVAEIRRRLQGRSR